MKWSKKILVMIFGVFVAHFAVAQVQDATSFPTEKVDPIKTVQLYPNPAVEYLVVHFTEPYTTSMKLTIHSIVGNAVEVERENIDDHEIHIRVKDLPPGYYFLAVKDDGTSLRNSYKFLKR